jgi:hypothetical protein
MEKNHSFEQKRMLKEQQRKRKERRKNRIISVISFVVILYFLISPLYSKANKERVCTIHSIEDNRVIVRHPNNKLYSFITDKPEFFKEDIEITVIFNELTDWDKNYKIKGVK